MKKTKYDVIQLVDSKEWKGLPIGKSARIVRIFQKYHKTMKIHWKRHWLDCLNEHDLSIQKLLPAYWEWDSHPSHQGGCLSSPNQMLNSLYIPILSPIQCRTEYWRNGFWYQWEMAIVVIATLKVCWSTIGKGRQAQSNSFLFASQFIWTAGCRCHPHE